MHQRTLQEVPYLRRVRHLLLHLTITIMQLWCAACSFWLTKRHLHSMPADWLLEPDWLGATSFHSCNELGQSPSPKQHSRQHTTDPSQRQLAAWQIEAEASIWSQYLPATCPKLEDDPNAEENHLKSFGYKYTKLINFQLYIRHVPTLISCKVHCPFVESHFRCLGALTVITPLLLTVSHGRESRHLSTTPKIQLPSGYD